RERMYGTKFNARPCCITRWGSVVWVHVERVNHPPTPRYTYPAAPSNLNLSRARILSSSFLKTTIDRPATAHMHAHAHITCYPKTSSIRCNDRRDQSAKRTHVSSDQH